MRVTQPLEVEPAPAGRTTRDPGPRRLTSLALGVCLALSATACGAAGTQPPSIARATAGSTVTPGASATATQGTGASSPTATQPTSAPATLPAQTTAPTPVPSGTVTVRGTAATFTSLRYGYSLTVSAADWVVQETPGTWNGVFHPNNLQNPDPGTDWFREPGVATIEIGTLGVAGGTAVTAWEASEAPSVRMLDCREATSTEPVSLVGLQVLLLPETCPKVVVGEFAGDQYFLNAFMVHGTSGIVAQWNSVQGHEASDRATFLRILGTLRFGASS
jgi:hypothetical protein